MSVVTASTTTSTSTNTSTSTKNKYKWDIVWINVILLGALHLLMIYGYTIRSESKIQTVIFAKTTGIIALLGVTAGAHRLWSHRTFKANLLCEILLAAMMSMTYQNSIYIWCRDHRLHHKHSETDADPHNANRGFFFSHMGWLMVRKHKDVIEKGKTLDMSDLEANPVVMFQHKYYYPIVTTMTFILPTVIPWYFWDEVLWHAFIASSTAYVMGVNLTWCINSLAHLHGEKSYDKNIGPRQNTIMKYLGMGEGFHNFHHVFPCDYRASEFDSDTRNLTALVIDGFAKVGMATDLKTAPEHLIKARVARTGDGSFGKDKYCNLYSTAVFLVFVAIL